MTPPGFGRLDAFAAINAVSVPTSTTIPPARCVTGDCDDGNPCTDDTCDPATGCQHAANTASCSDGSECTLADQCNGGQCQPGPRRPARRRLRCRRDGRTGLLHPRWCWFRGQPRRWHMRVMIEPYVEVTATLPVCLQLDGRLFVFELDGVPVEISTRNVPNEDGTWLGKACRRRRCESPCRLTASRRSAPHTGCRRRDRSSTGTAPSR